MCESYLGNVQVSATNEKEAQCKAAKELGIPIRKQYTIFVKLISNFDIVNDQAY